MRWTPKNLFSWSVDLLSKAHVDNPCLDSEVLLAHALGCSRERVLMEPDRVLKDKQLERYRSLVERRVRREPIHYIIGSKEFWSLKFKVAYGILIPRHETEFLIQCLLELNPDRFAYSRILDIGTGSGVLAIVSALELPESNVVSMDIDPVALGMAHYNASIHRVEKQVRFLKGDVFDVTFCNELGMFDYILANPPYILSNDLGALMPEVRDFEPHHALDGGYDGLAFYRRIIPFARHNLWPGGYLIMEIGSGQWTTVSKILEEYFSNPKFLEDHSGKPRVVFAKKEQNG